MKILICYEGRVLLYSTDTDDHTLNMVEKQINVDIVLKLRDLDYIKEIVVLKSNFFPYLVFYLSKFDEYMNYIYDNIIYLLPFTENWFDAISTYVVFTCQNLK